MTNEVERKAALKRQSDDYMALAREKADLGLEREAAAAAYQAGYFALMTALTAAEVKGLDHPSAEAAKTAAMRLGTTSTSLRLAVDGATSFYACEADAFSRYGWGEWAAHLRRITGIGGE